VAAPGLIEAYGAVLRLGLYHKFPQANFSGHLVGLQVLEEGVGDFDAQLHRGVGAGEEPREELLALLLGGHLEGAEGGSEEVVDNRLREVVVGHPELVEGHFNEAAMDINTCIEKGREFCDATQEMNMPPELKALFVRAKDDRVAALAVYFYGRWMQGDEVLDVPTEALREGNYKLEDYVHETCYHVLVYGSQSESESFSLSAKQSKMASQDSPPARASKMRRTGRGSGPAL